MSPYQARKYRTVTNLRACPKHMSWLLKHFKIIHLYKYRLVYKSSSQLPVVPFANSPVQGPYIYNLPPSF
jgi:hypothetical protein